MDFQNILSNLGSFVSGSDIFLIIIFFVGAFLYGFSLGRNRLIVLIVSMYISLLLLMSIPFKIFGLEFVEEEGGYLTRIGIFAALALVIFFLMPHSIISSPLKISPKKRGTIFQVLVFSALQIGMLVAVVMSFLPEDIVNKTGPLINKTFIDPVAYFFWLLLPITALLIFKKRKKLDRD